MFRLAHSLFLLRFFREPQRIPILSQWNEREWDAALGEPYRDALSRLLENGYLLPACLLPETAAKAIQSVWGVPDLKIMSHARGLKVSRSKAELAVALLTKDFTGIKAAYEVLGLLV